MSEPNYYGATFTLYGRNTTLRGRGIIDASGCITHSRNVVGLWKNSNFNLEGVIIRDPAQITCPIHFSKNVAIKNLKVIGYRANSDCIDIYEGHDVTVDGCFLRSWDDLIIVNTAFNPNGTGGAGRIIVKNCVLWTEWAHALCVGGEMKGGDVDDVLFTNCDVIHDKGMWYTLEIFNSGDATVRNVCFKDIRVEESRNLMSVFVGKSPFSHTAERGHVSGVTFENIRATVGPRKGFHESVGYQYQKDGWSSVGPNYYFPRATTVGLQGFDESHAVEDVTFRKVVINGKPLSRKDISANSHVKGVHIRQ